MNNRTHRHKGKKRGGGGGGVCVSPLSILQSIDPARLLSAGYVSCTAALLVRGRAKAAQGRKEAQINVESSNRGKEGKKGKTDDTDKKTETEFRLTGVKGERGDQSHVSLD